MSDANAQASDAEDSGPPWGDEITPLTEVCGGQYVLLHELARGDLSIVYRAKPAGTRDSIAFKVIQQQFVEDEVQVRRFRREAELLKKIEHPNVVRLVDHGTIEDGRDFIALELLVGSTLAEARAKSTRMSPERTCRIARQVARALRTMHLAGVIHRDLEPENILLIGPENAERVKLVDFSQAGDVGAPARRVKVDATRPKSGLVADEPSYRAPEQVRKRSPHPSMDVFALGVIMYEMLTGEHPFYQPSPTAARTGPMTIRSKAFDAPEELLGLVADCIEEDPAERPSSMDEVIERIDKALLWMGVVPHEVGANADEDARTQLWAAAQPVDEGPKAQSQAPTEPTSGPVWSHDDSGDSSEDEPVVSRRKKARRDDSSEDEPVVSRRKKARRDDSSEDEPVQPRRGRRAAGNDLAADASESGHDRPLSDGDPTPDPDAERVREPTGPESQAPQDGPTTGSVPRIDIDELEGKQTADDGAFVVDTVAWTKPQPAAKGKAKPAASRKAPEGKEPSTRSKGDEKGDERRERRPQATRPRTTSNQPPVAPMPRWVLPLGLLIIALLAYGVWMVWTA